MFTRSMSIAGMKTRGREAGERQCDDSLSSSRSQHNANSRSRIVKVFVMFLLVFVSFHFVLYFRHHSQSNFSFSFKNRNTAATSRNAGGKYVTSKVVYVAHVSVPLPDVKASDTAVEQVLSTIRQFMDTSKQLVYIGAKEEPGQTPQHEQRLRLLFNPAAVFASTPEGATMQQVIQSLRDKHDMPCDELVLVFQPAMYYWNWAAALLKTVKTEMPNCKTTFLLQETFWDRWRIIQQDSTVDMARDFPWIAQDWKLLKANMLRFMSARVDKFAFPSHTLLEKFAKELPSRKQDFFYWPHAVVTDEQSCSPETQRQSVPATPNGFLVVLSSSANVEYVNALYEFVQNVVDKLPSAMGSLHVVGSIRDLLVPGKHKADYLLRHPRVQMHGQIKEEQLKVMERSVIATINPLHVAVGGVSTKTLRAMSSCVPTVYVPDALPVASPELEALGVVCSSSDCFVSALQRLYKESAYRHKVIQAHIDFIDSQMNPSILGANILHWLGYQQHQINGATLTWGSEEQRKHLQLSMRDVWLAAPQRNGVYIAALVRDMSHIFSHFSQEIFRFLQILEQQQLALAANGQTNHYKVFIKMVSSNNKDNTLDLLNEFQRKIPQFAKDLKHLVIEAEFLVLDGAKDQRKSPKYKDNRADYLGMMRNVALDRLSSAYSKVLFLNDVVTIAEDMYALLQTNGGQYDQVCSLDFVLHQWSFKFDGTHSVRPDRNLTFYDIWVGRDATAQSMTSRYPWFSRPQDVAAIEAKRPVQAYSCWNGMTAIDSSVFLQSGLWFPESGLTKIINEAGEISHKTACMEQVLNMLMWERGHHRIFVNPCIQVAYTWEAWDAIQSSSYYRDCKQSARAIGQKFEAQAAHVATPIRFNEPPKRVLLCGPLYVPQGKSAPKPINEPDFNLCNMVPNHRGASILIRGQVFAKSSFAVSNYNLVQGISMLNQQARRYDPITVRVLSNDDSWLVMKDLKGVSSSESLFLDHMIHDVSALPSPSTFDLCITMSWEHDFRPCQGARRTALWFPWEMSSLPKHYVPLMNQMDEIWVTASFLKRFVIEAGVSADKVFVVPVPISDEFSPAQRQLQHSATGKVSSSLISVGNGSNKGPFNFLFVGGWLKRKAVDVMLRAYEQEFKPHENVCLTIISTYHHGTDLSYVTRWNEEQKAGIKTRPCLRFVDTYMERQDVINTMEAADTLLQPYRTEGFGMPIAEAMMLGTPVLTTEGGASDDFVVRVPIRVPTSGVNTTVIMPLRAKSREVACTDFPCQGTMFCVFQNPSCMPLTSAPRWREPDLANLQRLMRYSVTNRKLLRQAAMLARDAIHDRFSPQNVASHIVNCHALRPSDSTTKRDCRRR